jgi:CubicO group peptidase (beta-lactamase class C family)
MKDVKRILDTIRVGRRKSGGRVSNLFTHAAYEDGSVGNKLPTLRVFCAWLGPVGALLVLLVGSASGAVTFPGANWELRTPVEMGLDAAKLDQIAGKLGSSGCIIKDGYVVKTWGSQSEQHDWFSSAKPIFSTLLFFAIHEGRISSMDEKISKWGWPLKSKDNEITFRHLANMTSGYMQPEEPGRAYAHNDYAVALFIRTLEKVFDQSITEAARQRIYNPLGMQDHPHHQALSKGWKARGRAWISVRDWARLVWFWANKGNWNGRQLLPESYFQQYMSTQVPTNLPYSRGPNIFGKLPGDILAEDYLGVRSFGGGSNHYNYGVGLYGFHWYFNTSGTVGTLKLAKTGEDPTGGKAFEQVWPGLPSEITMTLGWGINSVMIPSMGTVQVCAGDANWDHPYLAPKGLDAFNYRIIKLLVESLNDSRKDKTQEEISAAVR